MQGVWCHGVHKDCFGVEGPCRMSVAVLRDPCQVSKDARCALCCGDWSGRPAVWYVKRGEIWCARSQFYVFGGAVKIL